MLHDTPSLFLHTAHQFSAKELPDAACLHPSKHGSRHHVPRTESSRLQWILPVLAIRPYSQPAYCQPQHWRVHTGHLLFSQRNDHLHLTESSPVLQCIYLLHLPSNTQLFLSQSLFPYLLCDKEIQ